jgi:hypothetical protein
VASKATRLGGTMKDSEDDPTTCEKEGLVDDGVIRTGLYGTSVQLGLGSLALPFADALEDVPSSAEKTTTLLPLLPSPSSSGW